MIVLDFLKNHPDLIPQISEWYWAQWGFRYPEESAELWKENLKVYLNIDKIPLMILAFDENKLIGMAQLKIREIELFPEKEFWLGGVYVDKEYRGRWIARKIINEVLVNAQKFKVENIYLQTNHLDGGIYSTLGWRPEQQIYYKSENVLIMNKKIQ